jgi:hypothetical protein
VGTYTQEYLIATNYRPVFGQKEGYLIATNHRKRAYFIATNGNGGYTRMLIGILENT